MLYYLDSVIVIYAVEGTRPTSHLADALHLAAAIESGCDVFLTNDHQLANFPNITIEVLP